MENYSKLISNVNDKKVFLGTHWDADGVTSGALIYHMIKNQAKSIKTLSKGLTFQIEPEDMDEEYDVVIATDIQVSDRINPTKIIYIDHHPLEKTDQYLQTIHDPDSQSCSLLIWDSFKQQLLNPYSLFLVMLGFFGDGGKIDDLPAEIYYLAAELMPKLMVEKKSMFNNGTYLELQKYVSLLNVGKRVHWTGDLPLELLKSADSPETVTNGRHPIARELNEHKLFLRKLYNMPLKFNETDTILYTSIECENNIQGVLCARHIKNKPILIINKYQGQLIGSMRVPDHMDFDAGAYLDKQTDKFKTYIGGGHEKAGGFTIDCSEEEELYKKLKDF